MGRQLILKGGHFVQGAVSVRRQTPDSEWLEG